VLDHYTSTVSLWRAPRITNCPQTLSRRREAVIDIALFEFVTSADSCSLSTFLYKDVNVRNLTF
jgi:hypothetical protein